MTDKKLLFKDVQDQRMDFLDSFHEYWIKHEFLTWQWWLLLITMFLVWVIWVKTVDRKRTQLILNFGLLVALISTILDMVGINHGLWAYPIRLYWAFIPPLIPYDLAYLPVIYMLVYQRHGQRWLIFLIVMIVVSAILAFIIEPLFHLMGIYVLYKWKYIYSFPIYILIACFVKFLVELINKKLQ